MHRILVVGERPEEVKALAFRLGLLGYEATPSASDLALALRSLISFKPDALILDAGAAQGSRELFRLLEKVSQLPIVVLGDGSISNDLVWYLEQGAVDYLGKPVSPTLLSARLGAVLRRKPGETRWGTLAVGSLEMDLERHQVRRGGQLVPLTPTEFRLLQVLAEYSGRACSRRMLLERVWGEDFAHCAHYLRLYIGYLRQKLEDDPKNPRLLVTEWGVGYRLVAADQMESGRTALRRLRAALA